MIILKCFNEFFCFNEVKKIVCMTWGAESFFILLEKSIFNLTMGAF